MIMDYPSYGIHYLYNCYDCQCDQQFLMDAETIILTIESFIVACELTPLEHAIHHFHNDEGKQEGFSAVIILEESHLGFNIHTWPGEAFKNSLQFDIYVCNYITENTEKAKQLVDKILQFFKPNDENHWSILR